MFRLIETIKIQDRMPVGLHYHHLRMNQARRVLNGCTTDLDLAAMIHVPDRIGPFIHKCRIIYSKDIESVEFLPYAEKKIETLKLVFDDTIDYPFKFQDRAAIERLMEERGDGDDILIIRQGLITDTSYCNILFFDGVRWVTPDEPLLRGTKRAALIEHGIVFPLRIACGDLNYFSHFMLVNALLDFDVSRAIDISGILR